MSNDEADRDAQQNRELRDAIRKHAWDDNRDSLNNSWTATIEFGQAALRAPSLISGAAIAATLAFVSANQTALAGQSDILISTLTILFIALLLPPIATGGAYFTQMFYTIQAAAYQLKTEHPYVESLSKAAVWKWAGHITLCGVILLVVASYALLVYGALLFRDVLLLVFAASK